jgi:hypothetical protein
MDPIGAIAAVLQISKNAYSLGSYIHKVYEGAKRIDESIVNLANEVDYLANSCGLVHNELHIVLDKSHPGALESRYDKDGRLGRCVDQQVAQCDVTLKELGKIVDTLWPRKATFIERASKQIDLQHSRDKIDGIRKQIRSHTDALHTILLVVNIRVAHRVEAWWLATTKRLCRRWRHHTGQLRARNSTQWQDTLRSEPGRICAWCRLSDGRRAGCKTSSDSCGVGVNCQQPP